jgi:hypothetical protein
VSPYPFLKLVDAVLLRLLWTLRRGLFVPRQRLKVEIGFSRPLCFGGTLAHRGYTRSLGSRRRASGKTISKLSDTRLSRRHCFLKLIFISMRTGCPAFFHQKAQIDEGGSKGSLGDDLEAYPCLAQSSVLRCGWFSLPRVLADDDGSIDRAADWRARYAADFRRHRNTPNRLVPGADPRPAVFQLPQIEATVLPLSATSWNVRSLLTKTPSAIFTFLFPLPRDTLFSLLYFVS